MFRTLAISALFLSACSRADAQLTIRVGPRPAGMITRPALPLPGSPLQHLTVAPPYYGVRQSYYGNPYNYNYNLWGYAPYYPYASPWYDSGRPTTLVNNVILPAPEPVPLPPPPPPELRARLTLNIPQGAKVWLAGKEVDAAVAPLLLESPALKEGQTYSFDVKVTWIEGRSTEERKRIVVVDAGDMKSLTYFGAR